MTKDGLIALVSGKHKDQEQFYMDNGPGKHEQEYHYNTGVNVVDMNIGLLMDWLLHQAEVGMSEKPAEAQNAYFALADTKQREVWEASSFHFGMHGYTERDAEHWWGSPKTPKKRRFLWVSEIALIVEADNIDKAYKKVIRARMEDTTPGLTEEESQKEAEDHYRKNDQLIEIDGEL